MIVGGYECIKKGSYENGWLLRKYSPDGKLAWETRFNSEGKGTGEVGEVLADSEGNIYVSGYAYAYADPNEKEVVDLLNVVWVVYKYDPSGKLLWKLELFTDKYDWHETNHPMCFDDNGNIVTYGSKEKLGFLIDTNGKILKKFTIEFPENIHEWAAAVNHLHQIAIVNMENLKPLRRGSNLNVQLFQLKP